MSLIPIAPCTSRRVQQNPDLLRNWSPELIDSMILWLDAADDSTFTLDGSDNVEEWRDKSGNDFHMGQTTSTSRPARVVDGVEFGNPDSFSTVPSATEYLIRSARLKTTYPFSCFFVADNTNHTASNNGPVIGMAPTTSTAYYLYSGVKGNNLAQTHIRNIGTNVAEHAADWTSNKRNVIYSSWDQESRICLVNDSETPAENTGVRNIFATNGNTFVGIDRIPSGSYPCWSFSGIIREIIFLSQLATTEEQSLVNNYLNNKWSVY